MPKKDYRILTQRNPTKLTRIGWLYDETKRKVRVMCEAEGYAMVRFPMAAPFCVSVKDLSECPKEGGKE